MNRKDFIRWCISGVTGTVVLPLAQASRPSKADIGFPPFPETTSMQRKKGTVRFGICSDVHQDFFFDVPERMQKFIHEMNRERVDFIIQLGDFCMPKEENRRFMDIWNSFDGPKYHVLGNHDTQISDKKTVMDFIGFPAQESYYSFDLGEYHFIVLDLNFGMKNNRILSYDRHHGPQLSPFDMMSDEELDWLEKDLASTRKPTILFSHQTLNKELNNKERFDKIIQEANRKAKKVIVAFSGHDHCDWVKEKAGVHHCQINSMTYFWAGEKGKNKSRYPEQIYQKYPIMQYMIPYKDPLYAIVELNPKERTIRVIGKQSSYVGPGPKEIGYPNPQIVSPCIGDRLLQY